MVKGEVKDDVSSARSERRDVRRRGERKDLQQEPRTRGERTKGETEEIDDGERRGLRGQRR